MACAPEAIHGLQVHPHDEVLAVHRHHFPMEFRDQGARDSLVRVQVGRRLDMRQQVDARAEEAGAERNGAESFDALGILAEEVEIETEVEDAEVLLAVVRTEQIRTESRAASDHLPELDLRVDRLEEDQVRNLGMSMPVSSISTEMAMCGAVSFCAK